MITGKNYIGNNLIAEGNTKFKTYNPNLEQENVWNFIEASEYEINMAAEKANHAFKLFRKTTFIQRADFLESIASEMEEVKNHLINAYILESGLPETRAIAELDRTLLQLRLFSDYLKSGKMNTIEDDGSNLIKQFLPLGPVAVFGASNFPFAYSTAGGDTASALAAGCPVIVKSHPMHSGTGELVASAIIKAVLKCNMPDGVFSNLNGTNISVGTLLIKNKWIKAVGFTGSLKGGRAIFDVVNQRKEPIPVFAEMGSNNPIIITKKALQNKSDFWVDKIADSMLQSAGQFCTSPGIILALESEGLIHFAQKLATTINESTPQTMLGPSIKSAFLSQKENAINQKGVRVLTKPYLENGLLSQPTLAMVDGSDFQNNRELQEEVFGSFILIVKCKDVDELLEVLDTLNGQLTGTFISESNEIDSHIDILQALQNRVGRLIFNGVPTGVQVTKNMNHGGPYPASTDSRFTAVGTDSILRWLRPICYQNLETEYLDLFR